MAAPLRSIRGQRTAIVLAATASRARGYAKQPHLTFIVTSRHGKHARSGVASLAYDPVVHADLQLCQQRKI